jgi:RNA recognition motif 2
MQRVKYNIAAPLVLNNDERDLILELMQLSEVDSLSVDETRRVYEYSGSVDFSSVNVADQSDTPRHLPTTCSFMELESKFGEPVDPYAVLHGTDTRTTVMFRRVQRRLSQELFKEAIESVPGLTGSVEFVYLPRDNMRRSNRGFAFVNFVSPISLGILASMLRSSEGLQQLPLAIRECRIYYARIQGNGSELATLIDQKQCKTVSEEAGSVSFP